MNVLGIDLGTSNTVVCADGKVVSHQGERGDSAVLPSIVAFVPNGTRIVGSAAKWRRPIDPKNTVYSAKRIIGRHWVSSRVAEFKQRCPVDLVEIKGGEVGFKTRAGVFSPIDIAATIIQEALKGMPTLGRSAVITVPSEFNEAAKKATLQAATQAGLSRTTLLEEPLAAAWAYATRPSSGSGIAVIYDFGGGTFNVAVVQRSTHPFRLLAQGSDMYLGGDDIDHAIADWAIKRILSEFHWDLRSDPIVAQRLVMECERAKMRLCQMPSTTLDISHIDTSAPASAARLSLGVTTLAELSCDFIRRTFLVCDEVLGRAGVKVRDVQDVLLTGGTTLLPMVRTAVAQYFGRTPRHDLDALHVVSLGAAHWAAEKVS